MPDWACATNRARRPSRRDTSTTSSDATVMMPSPPTCIRARITTWPGVDHDVPVSTVTSPVTHTADVAVNTLSRTLALRPSADDAGRSSSPVPTAMPTANAPAMTWPGLPARGR